VLGTVTVISVSGAAETAARLGEERWAEVRSSFREILRDAQSRYRGRATMVSLDGISAIFDGPARAIAFAAEVVEQTRRLGLRVGAGLHTGDVDLTGNELGGTATHLATRVASLAEPGEVLVSGTVVGLAAGSGMDFEPMEGRGRSSLPDGWRLYRLLHELPNAEAARVPASILVQPVNALTPREREVAAHVAHGRSNREIGDELTISVSTAERHVANILMKLGFRSRAQIAAWSASQTVPAAWRTSGPALPAMMPLLTAAAD